MLGYESNILTTWAFTPKLKLWHILRARSIFAHASSLYEKCCKSSEGPWSNKYLLQFHFLGAPLIFKCDCVIAFVRLLGNRISNSHKKPAFASGVKWMGLKFRLSTAHLIYKLNCALKVKALMVFQGGRAMLMKAITTQLRFLTFNQSSLDSNRDKRWTKAPVSLCILHNPVPLAIEAVAHRTYFVINSRWNLYKHYTTVK